MKAGLNKMDIRKYHRMLDEETPLKIIAKRLHTEVKVLKRFSPEKVAKAEKAQKAAEAKAKVRREDNRKKASLMADAAVKVMADN